MKEKIDLKDFLEYTFLSNLTVAPDEKHFAYVKSTCDEKKQSYQSFLHVSDGKTHMALTSHGKEQQYIWDDDSTILFSNMRSDEDVEALKKGEEKTVFYRISIHGGEAQKAFCIPLLVQSMKKIEKHTYVLLVYYDLCYSSMYFADEEKKQALLTEKKEMSDYEVLNELPFYGNGAGYTNKKRNVLFLYDETTKEITRMSDVYCNVNSYVYSEEHNAIYYTGEAYTQKPLYKDGIYKYDRVNKQTDMLLKPEVYTISDIHVWQHDILAIASDQMQFGVNENCKFYKLDSKTNAFTLFSDYEDAIGNSVGSDVRYGGGRAIKVYKDTLYFITTLFNRSVIHALISNGDILPIYECEGSVDDFDGMQDSLYFVGLQEMHLQEVYSYDLKKKKRKQISTFNESYYMKKDIRPCIPCNFSQEDMELYGWVIEPSEYDATKSYPAILDIHGGPKTVYGEVFYHEMQLWANQGYFVFFMNPRGGDGRGNTFADLRGKYGTIDYDDLMKFTDVVLKKYPSIDSARLGVTGGSYGGFMTNWIIGHNDRFQAAVSQRSIANWISFAYTSDIGEVFGSDQQAGNSVEDIEKLWWHSPLKYANKCTTPTLFIHSDEDYRCPYSEGLQMYSALCEHGVKTRLCMFKGENHELSRSGKPKHRVKRLEEITNWMNSYLK